MTTQTASHSNYRLNMGMFNSLKVLDILYIQHSAKIYVTFNVKNIEIKIVKSECSRINSGMKRLYVLQKTKLVIISHL